MKSERLKKTTLSFITIALFSVSSSFQLVYGQAAAATNAPPLRGSWDAPAFMSGEVLVKFRADVTDPQIAQAFRGAGLQMVEQIQTPPMRQKGDLGITRALTAMPVEQAVAVLNLLPGIEYAEPNWIYQHQATLDDPYFLNNQLWGMYGDLTTPKNQYGSQAAENWPLYIGSRQVVVGVIDEGIQITHPDLAANIWLNPGEVADGVDNDGNGYVDDIYGWDFYENNNTVYDGTGDDHGTHVTGTIGAEGGNGKGVVGVNWAVSIISGKFLGPNGGTTADAVEAVDYFVALKNKGVNIVALNNSWSGGAYSQSLHDAIIRAAKAGILFVAASGNGNRAGKAIDTDATPSYPACYNTTVGTTTETAASYDAVISVTAIDSSGNKASFANYGATTVDLGAPGVGINSTLPTDTYGSYSGTSMATPHVTGAIALYASTHSATAAEIKTAILTSTAYTPSLNGKTVSNGRLDLSTVIQSGIDQNPPAVPSGLAATAITYSQINLSWTDTDNETYFQITRTSGTESKTITVGANQTSYTDLGLSQQTEYIYLIRACNSAGFLADSSPVSATTPEWQPPTASFVSTDTTTQGNWMNQYGSEAYNIVRYNKTPSFGMITAVGSDIADPWNVTIDERALQTPDGSARFAACYYKNGEFFFDVNLANDKQHRVSLYCVDMDRLGRVQDIWIENALNGYQLGATYKLELFGEGKYLTWDISGHIRIKVRWTGPSSSVNAVVSGIFIDPVPDALPTVSITSPANGATVSGTVPVTANASDDMGVKQVEFFVGNDSIGVGTLGTDGWSITWDTTLLADAGYALTAIATDTAGQKTTSAQIIVAVDNKDDPPVVSITSPANGATVSGTVTVTATAIDDRGVNQVAFFAGNEPIGSDTLGTDGWSITWDTTLLADAGYALTAIATDTAGQKTTSAAVTVTVANTAPPTTTMHCDLAGVATSLGSAWTATVTVAVHYSDLNHSIVEGATVTGVWSGAYEGSVTGTTGGDGQIKFTTGSIPKNKSAVTFTISDVTKDGLSYDPRANEHGTSITIKKP